MHAPSYWMLCSAQENIVYKQNVCCVLGAQSDPGACCRLTGPRQSCSRIYPAVVVLQHPRALELIQGTIIDLKNHK